MWCGVACVTRRWTEGVRSNVGDGREGEGELLERLAAMSCSMDGCWDRHKTIN